MVIVLFHLFSLLSANARDFIKAIAIKNGKYDPKKHSHKALWHIPTIGIWALPSLYFGFADNWEFLLVFLMPFMQDVLYYIWKYIVYGEWMPDRLDWLENWYLFTLPPMTRSRVLIITLIGTILYTTYWIVEWII